MINLPRIISNGKPTTSVPVYSASISLNIKPLSSASITLAPGTQIAGRTYMELFTETGSVGVFRTRSPRTGIGSQMTTVDLDHSIAELGDSVITADLETECTLAEAAAVIFSHYKGNKWRLGSVAKGSTTVVLKASYDNCLDTLLDVLDQEPSVMLTFDFSAFPWTVNISARPTAITAEGRITRNVKSATITKDDTEHYTRVYLDGLPVVKKGIFGYLEADTKSKYGVIETEISGPNATPQQAQRTAKLYLEKHKEPRYSIQIEMLDLSTVTGEALDKLTLGKKMRLALPDYGITVEEVITQISWPSVYGDPKSATVTLSDEEDTILQAIKNASKAGRSNGKTIVKKDKEYSTRMEQNERNIDLWAGKTDANGKIIEEAGLYIDSKGVLQYARDKKNGLYAQIKLQADSVRTEVASAKSKLWSSIVQTSTNIYVQVGNAKSGIYSEIETTASSIRTSVSNSKSTIYSTIMQTATNIYTQVGNAKSGIYSNIEQTASSIRTSVSNSKSTIYSTIMQTATKIYTQVGNAKSDLYSEIEQTASSIRTSINDSKSTIFSSIMQTATNIYTQVGNAKSDTYSHIEQTASSIEQTVSSAKSSLWSSIVQTSTQISLKVSKDGIISSINQTPETITIQASKINLTGYVTATTLATDIGNISTITAQSIAASGTISASRLNGDSIYFRHSAGTGYTYTDLKSAFISSLALSLSGNTYTLKSYDANANETVVGTFSRATSLSGAWSGSGKLTVTASPQGATYERTLVAKTAVSGQVPIYAQWGSSGQYEEDTGLRVTAEAHTHSMSIARTIAGKDSDGTSFYKGMLYYYNAKTAKYVAVTTGEYYWYRSATSKSGTTTVYY